MVRYHKTIVIIPCLNESKTISSLVKNIVNHFDIIVIDDNSTDNSAYLAKKCGAEVIKNKITIGYSNSLNKGISYALDKRYQFAITIDADGEHSSDNIQIFYDNLKLGIPLVLGIRKKKQRFSEILIGIYFKIFYGVDDILCGLKGYNLEIFKNYFDEKEHDFIGTGMTYRHLTNQGKFCQINVYGKKRTDMPRFGNIFKSNIKILKLLIKFIFIDLKTHLTFSRSQI